MSESDALGIGSECSGESQMDMGIDAQMDMLEAALEE